MNKLQLIGILVFFSSLTAFGQSNDWKTLNEKEYSIQYPSNWELNQTGQMGTSSILFSPLSSEKDQFKENVNLLIQDLTGYNLDLDKYVEISEGQINTLMTDGVILESKRILSDSINYHKVIYTGKPGAFSLKFEQYYLVVNNKAFVLTLTCEENQFDDYKLNGEKILNSFQLIE